MRRKKRKKMSIIGTTHPPPWVKMKGKKMITPSPDWIDRREARNMRKKPAKIRAVPIVIRPRGRPRGLLRRRCLLAHCRHNPSSGR